MKWLARLKKTEASHKTAVSESTKPHHEPVNRGFVGFVAPLLACVGKTGGDSPAANDPPHPSETMTAEGDLIPDEGDEVSTTAAIDPDSRSWLHSAAMSDAEIDSFTARLSWFTTKGLSLDDGKALIDTLVTRDREADDRRTCLECTHLGGYAPTWGCRGCHAAGVAFKSRDAGLPGDFVRLLQRCDGFKDQDQQRITRLHQNHFASPRREGVRDFCK